jgi:CBS domain containing-hemolysin-like protein
MLGKLNRIARVGDTIETDGVQLKVEEMDGLRIARVSLHRKEEGKTEEAKSEH